MEPQIQYTQTEDDANIAYWTLCDGKWLRFCQNSGRQCLGDDSQFL